MPEHGEHNGVLPLTALSPRDLQRCLLPRPGVKGLWFEIPVLTLRS
jgi:hypothetical protein